MMNPPVLELLVLLMATAAVPPELAAHVRGLCRSYRAWLATMDRLAAPRA